MKNLYVLFTIASLLTSCGNPPAVKEKWIPLFNGENLDGWIIKIKGSPLGENYKNTFRVEDGAMKVSYSEYDTFDNEFGHIYYKTPYSSYKLRMEYRFTGDQCPGGPASCSSCRPRGGSRPAAKASPSVLTFSRPSAVIPTGARAKRPPKPSLSASRKRWSARLTWRTSPASPISPAAT